MKFYPTTRIEFAAWPLAPEVDPVRLVGQIWRIWMRRLVIRHLRRDLSALPDWLLHDIGIKRTDIPGIAVEIVDGGRAAQRATDGPRAA